MGNTANDLHIDAALSEMALGYRPEGFIADMVMPVVDVGKQSDLYVIWSRADRLRQQDTTRAPATEAKRIEESVSSASYYAKNYALKSSIPVEDFANADAMYLDNLNNGKTELVMDGLLLDWEARVANQVNSGANVGSYSAVASAWDTSNADPIGDINTGLDNVQYSTGKRPNRLTLGVKAWQLLRRHPDVRNIIYGTNNGGGFVSQEQVAALFEVEQVLVGGAFQNTGGEGLGESLSAIWGDHVLMHYTPMTASRDRPSFAYSFRWKSGNLPNFQVERHPYDTKLKVQDLEIGYYQDEVITGAEYGFLLTNVACSQ